MISLSLSLLLFFSQLDRTYSASASDYMDVRIDTDPHSQTCPSSSPSTTFNFHMLRGVNAYNVAWFKDTDNSHTFQSSMIQAVKHFRLAVAIILDAQHLNELNLDSATWNLGVAISYIECRTKVIDLYNFPIAQSWHQALTLPIQHAAKNKSKRNQPLTVGLFLEIGVGGGTTASIIDNALTQLLDLTTSIHGFDSFYGLPGETCHPSAIGFFSFYTLCTSEAWTRREKFSLRVFYTNRDFLICNVCYINTRRMGWCEQPNRNKISTRKI